ALKDPSWIKAMQEELLQFKMQKVWVIVDLPYRKRAIGTKWVYMNKKDERGIVIRNKARIVTQGHTQEDGIDYEEKFESKVILSPSSSAQSKEQDDKTKKEAKGKIPTFGQNSLNSTNTFSDAGPSNDVVSLTYGKTTYIDASKLLDDPDMPGLEDIIYSDDEDVVGAEAAFNNLESSVPVREEVDQSYMLFAVWFVGSTNPHNNAEDAPFDGKEHDFDVKKFESKVILSPSSSAQSKEQDDKTKKEAKGKSP
nr:copia protein [Tanacetum cinerariifolium]